MLFFWFIFNAKKWLFDWKSFVHFFATVANLSIDFPKSLKNSMIHFLENFVSCIRTEPFTIFNNIYLFFSQNSKSNCFKMLEYVKYYKVYFLGLCSTFLSIETIQLQSFYPQYLNRLLLSLNFLSILKIFGVRCITKYI